MMKKLIMDDFSLLGNALALAAKKAPTLESLAAELNVRQEDLSLCWFALNNLRRCQGRVLPVPFEAVAEGPADVRSVSGNWYAPTWRLNKLLEEFQVNEGLAVHYGSILSHPEGGHFELNLAADEVVRAVRLENARRGEAQARVRAGARARQRHRAAGIECRQDTDKHRGLPGGAVHRSVHRASARTARRRHFHQGGARDRGLWRERGG